jgi:hypothetical protein
MLMNVGIYVNGNKQIARIIYDKLFELGHVKSCLASHLNAAPKWIYVDSVEAITFGFTEMRGMTELSIPDLLNMTKPKPTNEELLMIEIQSMQDTISELVKREKQYKDHIRLLQSHCV